MRRMFLCILLLAIGCRAQSPTTPDLSQNIEKQVRSTFNLPPYVDVATGERKPSSVFPGYDDVEVRFSYGGQTQTKQLLLSKDGKTLFSMVKMDLTRDPLAETMAKIDLTGRPVRGNKDAKLTLVVYDDLQCPYCSRMHQTLIDLLKTYGDRIRVIYKDFPLVQIHPWAERAAINSGCLAAQSAGAYWDFVDTVHANGHAISGDKRPVESQHAELDKITTDIGQRHDVNMAQLKSCVAAQSKTAVEASMKEAEELNVEATPAVFINGMKMDGAIPEAEFRLILDRELKKLGQSTPAQAN